MSAAKFAKNVPFNFVNGTLTIIVGGNQFHIGQDDCRMAKIKEMLVESEPVSTEDDLLSVLKQNALDTYIGNISDKAYVKDGEVYFNGEVVHTSISARIKECMKFGLPFDNMLRFMENIAANPSYQSQKELFDFLTNKSLPITTDGCFLAYKAVRSDYYDKYTGKIYNGIGKRVEMKRPKVDDDRRNECSFGLHVGAIEYVRWYGNGYDDKIIYVKVNPKDVVSVPLDHNAQKVRVCEYEVLEEFKGELNSPVYDANLNPLGTPVEKVNVDWSKENEEWGDDWQYEPTYYDDDDDDDEYDYDGDADDDEFYDDYEDYETDWYGCGLNQAPQTPISSKVVDKDCYGVKPNGHKFFNHRGEKGKFAKCQ
jgi:hypothetical protein